MNGIRKFRLLSKISVPCVLFCLSALVGGCGPDIHQVDFLVSWSPDATRAALVPDFLDDDKAESGVWIFDSKTGKTVQIVGAGRGTLCAHPQWSPQGDQLLFAMIEDHEDSPDEDSPIPYSIYTVDPDGRSLSEIARSTSPRGAAFLQRNSVIWGPSPGTVVLQQTVDGRATAEYLDLRTGVRRPYLPGGADAYSLELSPDRRLAAALLYDREAKSAEIHVAESRGHAWHLVGKLSIAENRMEDLQPPIFWSPDSSRFAVPELAAGKEENEETDRYIRVVDARTETSIRVAADPISSIFWNEEGNSVVFSEATGKGTQDVIRIDLDSGDRRVIVAGGNDELLSWNREDGRIYFFRATGKVMSASAGNGIEERRLFACSADGKAARTLGRFYTGDSPSWSVSSAGNRVMVFSRSRMGGVINLTTGEAVRVHF